MEEAMSSNLERVKDAYSAWNDSKGGSVDAWLALMDDEVVLIGVDEKEPGLAFARNRRSRDDVVDYLTSITDAWEMIHFTPRNFLEDGDRISMFGTCAWRNKATGKDMECLICSYWRFKDGKCVELIDLFDSAVAARAAMP